MWGLKGVTFGKSVAVGEGSSLTDSVLKVDKASGFDSFSFMSDKIIINKLLVQGVIGVNKEERVKNQNMIITMVLYTNFHNISKSDNINDTVNYAWAAKQIERLVIEKKALTIEHLACYLADWALDIETVERVDVEIAKPSAIGLAKSATVKIERIKSKIMPHKNYLEVKEERLDAALISSKHLYGWVEEGEVPKGFSNAYLAIGSNLGNRADYIHQALELMKSFCQIKKLAFLYESPAQYNTKQPSFLNTAVQVHTELAPEELLFKLKHIEQVLGRDSSERWGPRPIDLDIIYYNQIEHRTSILTIPHPQLHERDFVLGPLMDICPDFVHPVLGKTTRQLFLHLKEASLKQVCPINLGGVEHLLYFGKYDPTYVMGIVNVTPDSFSDGGVNFVAEPAIECGLSFPTHKLPIIIDIGGESTRPGAESVTTEEELKRVIPVIQGIREKSPTAIISIDTIKPEVAEQALASGANILNDVGSCFHLPSSDLPALCKIAVQHRVPWILTHCRGTPDTMSTLADYPTGQVLSTVAQELSIVVNQALQAGVYPWHIITDPGVGFAKQTNHNLEVLRDLSEWHSLIGHFPLLMGPSRKRFIGSVTQQEEPGDRVWGTTAAITASIQGGANIVRVHDVKEMMDNVLVSDAIYKLKK